MTPFFGLAASVLLLRGGVRAVGVGRDGLVGRYGLNHLFVLQRKNKQKCT